MIMSIPGTAKEIVEILLSHTSYSIKEIASKIGVSDKTIYRIRRGLPPLPQTHFNLIQLYLNTPALPGLKEQVY